MNAVEIENLQQGLRSAHTAVTASAQGVTDEDAHQIPEPDEWTVAQLLAHIAEIQGFWMGKAVLITKEDDPQITRTAVENAPGTGAKPTNRPVADSVTTLSPPAASAAATWAEKSSPTEPPTLDPSEWAR